MKKPFYFYASALLLLSSLLCLPSLLVAQQGIPLIRNFSTAEYGAGIQNWQMAQDSRGMLYVANNFGLLQYDGMQWRTYGTPSGTKVRCLSIAADDKIYVGSQGDFGYFAPDAAGSLQYRSLAEALPDDKRNFDETWRIFQDRNTLYFCTFRYIFVFTDHKLEAIIEPGAPLEPSFYVNHRLYTIVKGKGLMQYKNNVLELLPDGEKLAQSSISGIVPYKQQQLLITTFRDGVFLYDGQRLQPWKAAVSPLLQQSIINGALLLKNGQYAFGTQGEGLLITDQQGELLLQLTKDRGLTNRTVLSLYQDRNNNLWAGMNNGLSFIELSSPFRLLNEQTGLPGTGYTGLLRQDTLYLGTNNGLYHITGNNSQPLAVAGARGQVYSLALWGNEVLMGHHAGPFTLGREKARSMGNLSGVWMFLPLRQHPNRAIGGTYHGLALFERSSPGGGWKLVKQLKGFNESARVMEQAADGSIWMTHGYKGAYNIRLSAAGDSILSVKHYHQAHGFPSNILINVFRIENDLLFTAETGIYRYHAPSDRFVLDEAFTRLLGPHNHIQIMQNDAFGNIYFIGDREIGVLRKDPLKGYSKESALFNRLQGLLNDDLESLSILEDHSLLLGAKEGFVHYNPLMQVAANPQFTSLLRSVRITNKGDSLVYGGHGPASSPAAGLPFSNNSLKFEFASTAYEAHSRPLYQFYLEPYEKSWSPLTLQSEKEYTNLPEGKYVFHIRSQNSLGQQSTEVLYRFTILPPWYRTAWAYSAYVLLASIVLILMLQVQHRRHKREKAHIVRQQEAELSLRDNQLEEVARKSEEEISRLQNEKLQAEIEHKNRELATQTMLIISRNEFISEIKDSLSSISKKSKNQEVMQELLKITRNIEHNINAEGDWEHFQYHFDQVHGDFSNRLRTAYPLLSPQEVKLCTYLRLNLSTKEIAQLLSISVRGVEISRYRLRKKLGLQRDDNLTDFMLSF